MSDFRDRLRGLPTFPDDLPPFAVEATPADPLALFAAWFDDAVAAGVPAPHAANLATADAAGAVHARMLTLKDVDADGFWFAAHATSPKGRDLAENPHAALTFFWRDLGRQVRVTGAVHPGPEAVSRADFQARPDTSRAAGLLPHQSEPLTDQAQLHEELAAALERVRADRMLAAPTWTAYVLAPTEIEFWQAAEDGHVRLRYRAGAAGWTKGLLWP